MILLLPNRMNDYKSSNGDEKLQKPDMLQEKEPPGHEVDGGRVIGGGGGGGGGG